MNTRFLFKGVEVNGLAREYILKRLSRLESLVDDASKFEIEIGLNEQKKFRVEVMIHTPHHLYRAEEISESAEGSTDMAVDVLEQQIVREKRKKEDARREGGRAVKEKLHSEM